jgi:hypothetical protein
MFLRTFGSRRPPTVCFSNIYFQYIIQECNAPYVVANLKYSTHLRLWILVHAIRINILFPQFHAIIYFAFVL